MFCEKNTLRALLGIQSEKPRNALLDSAIRAKNRAPVKKTKQTGTMLGDYLSRTHNCSIFDRTTTLYDF